MSCRGTNGNSATTSIAKFISSADDTLVSQVFHELRREALTRLGTAGREKAAKEDVLDFIEAGIRKAQTDNRIRDSRRESLIARFRAAENDAKNDNGPDLATFTAWQDLESRLLNVAPSSEALSDDTTIAESPEGIQIAIGDVFAARRLANEYRSYNSPEAVKKYNELSERANRIEAAYDSTDVGYAALLKSPDSDTSSSNHALWIQRKERAELNRTKVNTIAEAKKLAAETPIIELQNRKDSSLSTIRELEKKKISSSDPKFIEAKKMYNEAFRNYLYGVAYNNKTLHIASHKNLKSPTMWSRIAEQAGEGSRDLAWQSAELVALDLDRASFKMGLISKSEIERRGMLRAEARQTILDYSGSGEVDPVNRGYADKIRLQRRQAKIGA
jgi:hypothetical protein